MSDSEATTDSAIPHGTFPAGVWRCDSQGTRWVDAMAGQVSPGGLGFAPVRDTIAALAGSELGAPFCEAEPPESADGDTWDPTAKTSVLKPDADLEAVARFRGLVRQVFGHVSGIPTETVALFATSDAAIEAAIFAARRRSGGSKFRCIAAIGSDHGRSAMCRSASGEPKLQEGLGPLVAGFRHVPPGDVKALRAAVDEQTACILLSPLDRHDALRPLDTRFLEAAAEEAEAHGAALLIDESRLTFAGSGLPSATAALAEINVDGLILSAGLFGGLPGGLLLAKSRWLPMFEAQPAQLPLLQGIATASLQALCGEQVWLPDGEAMKSFAVALAEGIGRFPFVRDLHATGMMIGIETDVPASDLIAAASRSTLLVEAAGDHSIQLQPPVFLQDDERQTLISCLREAFEAVERQGASHVSDLEPVPAP